MEVSGVECGWWWDFFVVASARAEENERSVFEE